MFGMNFSPFEAAMLLCFGISWPISILKSLRTHKVVGKSPLFMGIVFTGYVSGVIHKVFFQQDWVIVLYIFNLIMVGIDIYLYYKYMPKDAMD